MSDILIESKLTQSGYRSVEFDPITHTEPAPGEVRYHYLHYNDVRFSDTLAASLQGFVSKNVQESEPSFYGLSSMIERIPEIAQISAHRGYRAASIYPSSPDDAGEEGTSGEEEPLVEALSEDQSTILGWSIFLPEVPTRSFLEQVERELDQMVEQMAEGRPLQRSAGLKMLARDAASRLQQREEGLDLEEWARRLAEDVSDATD